MLAPDLSRLARLSACRRRTPADRWPPGLTWRLVGDRQRDRALAREAATRKHALDDRDGLTMALETLARLFLPERAAETHVTNIMNKLGLNSRIRLAPLHGRRRRTGLTTSPGQQGWPGLGAGPGHPEPRRERARNLSALSMSIMPREP
jgi:hypothetical protein